MSNPLQLPLFKLGRLIVTLKPQLIDALGVEGVKFIDDNFKKQGFQGATFQPWVKRKSTKNANRAILVKSGVLRRSIQQTNNSDSVKLSTDIPYARIHNEGGEIRHPYRTVDLYYTKKGAKLKLAKLQTQSQQRKATEVRHSSISNHTTKMPKRQFMGDSPVLQKSAREALIKILTTALNNI